MAKSKLPTTNSMPVEVAPRMNRESEARERKYKAEDGLRTLQRAQEIKKDKGLLKDIKALAKEQLKAVSK